MELALKKDFESLIELKEVKSELNWWVKNLHLKKGKALMAAPPQLTLATDASLEG